LLHLQVFSLEAVRKGLGSQMERDETAWRNVVQ
jgi:hypothetical protein